MQNFSINNISIKIIILSIVILVGCKEEKKPLPPVNDVKIVPLPSKILYKRGYFELTKNTRILLNLSINKQEIIAEDLIQMILAKTGHKLKISDSYTNHKLKKSIELEYLKNPGDIPGSFNLRIASNKINIVATDNIGMTYAFNVLINLMQKNEGKWVIPQLTVEDKPYRKNRVIILNNPDTQYSIELEKSLINNRINYLFLPGGDTIRNLKKEIMLKNRNSLESYFSEPFMKVSTISELNRVIMSNSKNTIIFSVHDDSQLSDDSLQLIGQAFWSDPENIRTNKK